MKIEITSGVETPVTKFFSTTPETDAEACYPDSSLGECVDADFARKLERERDEAREELSRYKRQWEESRSENAEGAW